MAQNLLETQSIKKLNELNNVKKLIEKHESLRLPFNNRMRQLVQRRKTIEKELAFKDKFFRIASYSAKTAKHTSYFLSESVFAPKTSIDHIIDSDNKEYKDDNATEHVIKHFTSFFKKLPTSPPADEDTIPKFLRNVPADMIKKIPPEALNTYNSEITYDELDQVINKSHKGSAPGLSGISYELVKFLYNPLRPLILKFANMTIDKNTLSPFLRNRKVILIPKPNKPPTDVGSLRPICLLEIPYKLISSVIAERLKNFSNYILTYHQNAYSANSNIANCSRTILDFRTLARKIKQITGNHRT